MKIAVHLVYRWWLLLVVSLLLGGCSSVSSPLKDVFSAIVSDQWGPGKGTSAYSQPNPLYRYLRVEVQGRAPALLVLGYTDAHPQGDIEVWYSAKHEVIKIQNGRIVGTAGLETDWRAVQFPELPPVWSAISPQGVVFQRLRDEMPGHRFAIHDRIELKPWLGGLPPIHLPSSLSGEIAGTYRWFSETSLANSDDQPLPVSWFAWGMHRGTPTVVYSEQCLSATFCLKLQRWPIQEGSL